MQFRWSESAEVALAYTVIIFLARNGRTRAVKFRPKNFGRISFDFPNSANSSAEQWTEFAQIGRNSPEIFEGEPQLRGFAHFEQVSPKKILLCRLQLDPSGCLQFIVCILLQLTEGPINLLGYDNWLTRRSRAEQVNVENHRQDFLKLRSMNRVTASIVGIMIEGQLQGNWLPKSSVAGQEWRDKLKIFEERYCYV
jgi:hypothetical protein